MAEARGCGQLAAVRERVVPLGLTARGCCQRGSKDRRCSASHAGANCSASPPVAVVPIAEFPHPVVLEGRGAELLQDVGDFRLVALVAERPGPGQVKRPRLPLVFRHSVAFSNVSGRDGRPALGRRERAGRTRAGAQPSFGSLADSRRRRFLSAPRWAPLSPKQRVPSSKTHRVMTQRTRAFLGTPSASRLAQAFVFSCFFVIARVNLSKDFGLLKRSSAELRTD